MKLIWKPATRFGLDLELSLGLPLQYKTYPLTSPNFIIPFDYNLLILVVEHAYMVCPTTFIAKTSKFRGTSVNGPWLEGDS